MQPFEIVANALAMIVLAALATIHFYGRRRYESRPVKTEREDRN